MTVAGAASAAVEGDGADDTVAWAGFRFSRPRTVAVVVAVCVLLAFGLRLFEILRPGHLLGIVQYDDAVFLGAAVRLTDGVLPYRDFIFIQPPGVALILTPVAFLAKVIGVRRSMGLARLLVPLVAAANVALVGWLLRHRTPVAVGVGCLALAIYPDDLFSSTTVYQEPYLNLFCLLGAALLFEGDSISSSRRRLLLGGVAFGLAGTVKIWAIFPVLVLGLLMLRRHWRSLLPFAAGAAAGFLVVCLPFIILAASAFVHQVLVVQTVRSDVSRIPLDTRLVLMTGVVITDIIQVTRLEDRLAKVIIVGLALSMAVAFLLCPRPKSAGPLPASGWRARRRTTELERYALASTVLIPLIFLIPADFYFHYSSFIGPFLALSMALAVDRALPVLREPAFAVVAAVLLVALLHALLVVRGLAPAIDPAPQVDRLIPAGACVVTDDPAYLINANRYISARPGCPPLVDPFGQTLGLSGGEVAEGGAHHQPAVVADWLGYLEKAQYLALSSSSGRRIPWTTGLETYVHDHFEQLAYTPLQVLKRAPSSVARASKYSLPRPGTI